MLSNAYFLGKFRFDTAENEPAKNLQNFRKMHFSIFFENAFSPCGRPRARLERVRRRSCRPETSETRGTELLFGSAFLRIFRSYLIVTYFTDLFFRAMRGLAKKVRVQAKRESEGSK